MNVAHLVDDRMKHFKAQCREAGLRLTPQKLEIFRVIASTDCHPTAQDIFEETKKTFANVSFATVYDNVKKFIEIGVIRIVQTSDNKTRFDANMEDHHHIIDDETGQVKDVSLEPTQSIPIPEELKNKHIKEIKISYHI